MSVYIIILNWNRAALTIDCVRSLSALAYPDYRVLVLDNGSQDGSVEKVRAEFGDWLDIIPNETNLGFAGGNNIGIAYALDRGAHYVLLLNNDTVLLPGALETLATFMDNHPRVGACGPLLVYPDGSPQASYGHFPSLWTAAMTSPLDRLLPAPLGNHRLAVVPRQEESAHPVEYVRGACMLVRRETIEDVGLLDDRFFLYCEETDWCYRMKQKGWTRYYVPAAKIVHLGSQGLGKNAGRLHYEEYKSLRKYVAKYHAAWYGHLFGLVLTAALAANGCAFGILSLFTRDSARAKSVAQDQLLQARTVVSVWFGSPWRQADSVRT